MGRPRQFDEQRAVAVAGAEFRHRGYAATSVDHLVTATGVHRGSLYGTFGSKHGLFLRVLDRVAEPDVDPTERIDVVLVALLELAPADRVVRDRVAAVVDAVGLPPDELGLRLLRRAGITTPEAPTPPPDER